jgi:2'-phosphotransferase
MANTTHRLSSKQITNVSKTLSYALRHGVINLGLKMDDEGYVRIDDLLTHPELHDLRGVNLNQIREIVDMNDKKRFALKNDLDVTYIRANQGHSQDVGSQINDQLHLTKIVTPYETCVHGTNHKALSSIMKDGLSPMGRKHVHFAKGDADDKDVISGMRQSSSVKIYIDMKSAMADGLEFYESDNGVILCPQTVSPSYFLKIEK